MTQEPFWSVPSSRLLEELGASSRGLSADEAQRRVVAARGGRLRAGRPARGIVLLLHQFKNPIAIILIFAAMLAFLLGDPVDAAVILAIVAISGALGFWHEGKAVNAVGQLLNLVRTTSTVRREGVEREVGPDEVVAGDIVLLSPGDHVPGDGRLLSSNDLFIDEAALTGESFPVPKADAVVAAEAPPAQRTNAVFFGTHVVSGNGAILVVHTGRATEFGAIAERLRLRPAETAFEHGVRKFGYLLLEVTLLLVLAIFAFNVALHRPVLDSFLFGLALAVGLTPQLLPAIISVNLAHGARRMALSKVIVRRLASIENFGSMDILCCDKTGTLTEGVARVHAAISATGEPSARTLLCAQLNAFFQKGRDNPIDLAIRDHEDFDGAGWKKLDERPYDFARKRLSVLCTKNGQPQLCTKGAVSNVLDICVRAEGNDGVVVPLDSLRSAIQHRYEELSSQGYRTLAVAYRTEGLGERIGPEDEANLIFLGFVILRDPVKPGIVEIIRKLRDLGLSLKVITGDNRWIARTLGREVGIKSEGLLTGTDLHGLSEAALVRRAAEVDLFAEIEPAQKERIILALKKSGYVVGFVGDGINDATALHSADVGISVEGAVDVARQAADIVLLEKDLGVLATGVREGRATFANTMKYVLMATSANFGNMFSMAGASLLLPFLPLRPSQVLLMNLLTDLPEMTIASDRVDEEMSTRPQHWDIGFIQRFMLLFGLVSSVFDYLTFATLLWLMDAPERLFRTGWFVESVVSASLIVLVVRTRHPIHRSRPGRLLLATSLAVVAATLIMPYLPGAGWLGFQHLPPRFYLALGAIVAGYILAAELAKKWFYRHFPIAAGRVPRRAMPDQERSGGLQLS